jgi:putative transposase
MPSKKKPAAVDMAALPSIPKELMQQLTGGTTPMTAEQINATTMALKKALMERAQGAELSHHLGQANLTAPSNSS